MQAPAAVAQSPLSQSSLALYQRQGTAANDSSSAAAKTPEAPPIAAPQTDVVSLRTATELQAMGAAKQAATAAGQPPEVFAEIWRDGMKIGSIYTDGRATLAPSAAGIAAGPGGSSLPYLRAQEISRMVGGEVRYVDMQALHVAQTRSQLRAAYGG